MKFNKAVLILCILSLCYLSGCAIVSSSDQTLFTRIGGKEKLAIITSETLDKMVADPRTKRSFDGVKMKPLKESFTNFLCLKTGGDCVYEGETMKNSHADAKITTAEFELMVQALRETLDSNDVGNREKNELLKILAPMKHDVVYSGE